MTGNDVSGGASGRPISRRGLLKLGAGSVAAAAGAGLIAPGLAGAEDAVSEMYGPSVNGVLKERSTGSLVIEDYHLSFDWATNGLPEQAGPAVTAVVGEGASIYRDGPASMTDFAPGEGVVAFVRSDGASLVADVIEPLYRTVEGTVKSVGGGRLDTSAGVLVINDETNFRAAPTAAELSSAADISPGNEVTATCRVDSSGQLVAAIVSVA
jgi:hypothetical protein